MNKQTKFTLVGSGVILLGLLLLFLLLLTLFTPRVPDTLAVLLNDNPPPVASAPPTPSPVLPAAPTALELSSLGDGETAGSEVWIQIGALMAYSPAEILHANLLKKKFKAELEEVPIDNQTLYRVVIGPVAPAEQDKLLQQLQKQRFANAHPIYR